MESRELGLLCPSWVLAEELKTKGGRSFDSKLKSVKQLGSSGDGESNSMG